MQPACGKHKERKVGCNLILSNSHAFFPVSREESRIITCHAVLLLQLIGWLKSHVMQLLSKVLGHSSRILRSTTEVVHDLEEVS